MLGLVSRQQGAKATELEAIELVRAGEEARGWRPGPLLGQSEQHNEGCDFLSTPPDGGPPHPVEVKGWGDPLRKASGGWSYLADLRAEQLDRARSDPNWRLEIVANLTATREGIGRPQRLTLSAAEVLERAEPLLYRLALTGFEDRVVEAS
jgi:hypothetical protein